MSIDYDALAEHVDAIIAGSGSRKEALDAIVELLEKKINYYDWVGFYLVDPDRPSELYLSVFRGLPTEHTRIPIDTGICGAAVRDGATVIIADVDSDERYLACSTSVRSEIVVPIFQGENIVGEIDIDSDTLDAFTEQDRVFLESICQKVSVLF